MHHEIASRRAVQGNRRGSHETKPPEQAQRHLTMPNRDDFPIPILGRTRGHRVRPRHGAFLRCENSLLGGATRPCGANTERKHARNRRHGTCRPTFPVSPSEFSHESSVLLSVFTPPPSGRTMFPLPRARGCHRVEASFGVTPRMMRNDRKNFRELGADNAQAAPVTLCTLHPDPFS